MKPMQNHTMQDRFHRSIDTAQEDERRASRYLLWIVVLTLICALVWAATFHLDEITRGIGKVIPSSREQVVQSLDSGVLSEMFVREGDVVEKNQVLLLIDDSRSGPVYREAHEKWLALAAQAARLRAEAYDTELSFPEEVLALPAVMNREKQAYQARKKALDEQLVAMRQSLGALGREIAMTSPLVAKGVMSEVEILRLRRQYSDLTAQIAERRNRYYTDANNELVKVESDLAQSKENSLAREDAFKRAVIRSPMKGIVKNVQVTTIGAVIQAGQNILEIVPVHEEMLVEAYVKPTEVAFLELNQPVMVKLSAYDFNKYGGLEGKLEHLSPDTLRDETKPRRPGSNPVDLDEGFYRILVKITDAHKERHGKKLVPLPGMTATVEIKTGQKTVLEYLFRPLQSITQALRER